MHDKKLDQLILQVENAVECWKQLNRYFGLARSKKHDEADENQFLEFKCVITQELESILAQMQCESPTREEIHNLLMNCPSIRYLSELPDSSLRGQENQWHRIYISWHANLGQLKVKQRDLSSKSAFSGLFGRKKE